MKQHLRFLLLATLTSVPVVSVVACGTTSSTSISNEDILSKAAGLMRTHSFAMTNLGLTETALPADGETYTAWNQAAAKKSITEYYNDLVSNDTSPDWEHESVTVNIRSENAQTAFINKFESKVEVKIDLIADLTFKGLKTSTPLVVKITNDQTTSQDKIDKIGAYLITELNKSPVFEFSTLFKDGLTSTEAQYDKITSGLSTTLLNIIDVAGVSISVKPIESPTPTVIYNLDASASSITAATHDPSDPTKVLTPATVNGSLQNLVLEIGIKADNAFSYINLNQLTGDAKNKLKISQKFPDVATQIYGILNQTDENLLFEGDKLPKNASGQPLLPTEGQLFNDYVGTEAQPTKFSDAVQNELFNKITEIYNPTKMGAWWTKTVVSFPNGNASKFVTTSNDNGFMKGYFEVNVNFTAQFAVEAGNSIIITGMPALKINLRGTTTPTP